ncbi:DUF1304 domain-containing protein, partial [Klebsiella sp. Gene22]|uniref:DUF1304 domain-containing protein n=1 Tax=Klebsiella sp. Gene22 TaxID=3374542 RepID=UPI003D34A4F4
MLATLLVALVAIIQLAILVLEMFLWEGSAGRRAFNLSADFARQTRVLAANQGLYNGFLAYSHLPLPPNRAVLFSFVASSFTILSLFFLSFSLS